MSGPDDGARVATLLAAAAGVVVTTEFAVVGLMPLLAADLTVSLARAGWLVSAFALAAALAGPPLTLVAGRWPAPSFLALCVLVFGLGNLLAAALPVFGVHLAVRVVQGALLTPFISVASTLAAARVAPERAGWAVGRVNLGTVAGIVLAVPALVALAEWSGWRPVIALLGGLALGVAVLCRYRLPVVAAGAPSWRRQARVLAERRFFVHLALSALLFMAMFTAYSFIAAYLDAAAGLRGGDLALALLAFGVAGLAGNGWASRRVDAGPTAVTGLVVLALAVIGVALTLCASRPWLALLLLLPWGAAHAAAFVACQVRVMFAAPAAPAFAAALNIAVCNLGLGLGALFGGEVVARFGIAGVGLAAALVAVLALPLAGWLQRAGAAAGTVGDTGSGGG